MKVGIIVGSTRPNRRAANVARWVYERAQRRDTAEFEVVDIADFGLPLLDEPKPPGAGEYTQPHTQRWAAKIATFDAFIFVTPEYNHGIPAALKNALDFLYAEWNNKAAGFVGYGNTGGARCVEQLRLVMGELQIADVRSAVALSIFTDFNPAKEPRPAAFHEKTLAALLDELIAWAGALKQLREAPAIRLALD